MTVPMRASREQMGLIDEFSVQSYVLTPRWPFQGELRLRTME
jgi:hypothetical protein